MRPLGSETITVVKPTTAADSRDNTTVYDFTPPLSSTEVEGCNVQPFLISEKLQEEVDRERDYARTTWRVWVPVNATTSAISHHDRVEWRNQTYEVFGFIGLWTRFSGASNHIQFIMQLRSG